MSRLNTREQSSNLDLYHLSVTQQLKMTVAGSLFLFGFISVLLTVLRLLDDFRLVVDHQIHWYESVRLQDYRGLGVIFGPLSLKGSLPVWILAALYCLVEAVLDWTLVLRCCSKAESIVDLITNPELLFQTSAMGLLAIIATGLLGVLIWLKIFPRD